MKSRLYISALLITILAFSACVPTKFLADDERLLVDITPQGLERIEPTAIEVLYQQEPNRRIFGSTPYLALYNFGQKFYSPQQVERRIERQRTKLQRRINDADDDSTEIRELRIKFDERINRLQQRRKEGNFLMRIGEPPAIYDSTLMERTMEQISIYLNSNGFFNHNADYTKEEKGKLVYITINIDENIPYRYSNLTYGIPDSAILRIVQATSARSLIKPGKIYNEDELTQERDRLYEVLRNRGYYDFARAYIEFEVDTSYSGNTAQIKTIIRNPEQDSLHKVYTINKVYFKSDRDRFGIKRDTIEYNGINYIAYNHIISKNILDKKIDIYPGQRYSQLRTSTTQRKLADLDIFQFNNVSFNKVVDPADSVYRLDAFISSQPAKRFQETAELGLNYTERTPGPFSSVRLRVRNVFGGAENLDIGLRGGFEGQIGLTDASQTVMMKEFGGDVSLSFPVILLPFTNRSLLAEYNPKTRLIASYTNVDREEYKRSNYELGLDYIWQRYRHPLQPPVMQFIFSPVNLNIVQTDEISDEFLEELRYYSQGSRSLEESFRSGIISNMAFNFIYNTNDYLQSRNAYYLRTLMEVGGLTNELGLDLSFGSLRTFQYAKINPDFRRYIPLGRGRLFAFRVNMGVGTPLFGSSILPYDKYFFAGGASSVRAWQSRRLGPGSYATETLEFDGDQLVRNRDFSLEQPGEVLLEGSAEYRFNMFSFIDGAFFVDAGNVWVLREEKARPGANFEFNTFYKEIAVGTGFGIRLNLSVVVLRFDFATKVYDPGGINGDKLVLNQFNFGDFFSRNNQSNLNIGIGYPF
ncbi:BamA/TamA family outer membrane protein [Pontibacter silvestris]|uniref:BamA/TamA family outer membrane protein n=1 Tax=Pontibacter silvestris TaxID=2305183 RepID=A0ABW4WZY6_9BACT|nr:BamA/TamA family outer membrane protein [Pontibacter silvestris]MCC9135402.1 BamA/TamA family outer membrane protein [Pontibacter silvestris]